MPGPRRLVLALVVLVSFLAAGCVSVHKTAPAPAPMPIEASVQQAAPPPPPPPPPACVPGQADPSDFVHLRVDYDSAKGKPHTDKQAVLLYKNKSAAEWKSLDEISITFDDPTVTTKVSCSQDASKQGWTCVSQTFCNDTGDFFPIKYTVTMVRNGQTSKEDPVLIIRP